MQYQIWRYMKDSDQERFTSYDFVDAFGIKRAQANQALFYLRKKNVVTVVGRADPRYKPGPSLFVYAIADKEAVLPKPVVYEV